MRTRRTDSAQAGQPECSGVKEQVLFPWSSDTKVNARSGKLPIWQAESHCGEGGERGGNRLDTANFTPYRRRATEGQ